MERVLNPQKINEYVLKFMQERKEIMASELPLETTEDYVHMIYIRLYGQRKNMKYEVQAAKEVTVNGYRFKDYKIRKKGAVDKNVRRNAST